jgi:hypothetical protein
VPNLSTKDGTTFSTHHSPRRSELKINVNARPAFPFPPKRLDNANERRSGYIPVPNLESNRLRNVRNGFIKLRRISAEGTSPSSGNLLFIPDRSMQDAKYRSGQRVTIADLPSEILALAAEHLRLLPHEMQDYTPRVPLLCPCAPFSPLKFAKAQLRSMGHYQDEALAFSMTCKRMREIVFVERLERSITMGHCEESRRRWDIPRRLKERVRYVCCFAE